MHKYKNLMKKIILKSSVKEYIFRIRKILLHQSLIVKCITPTRNSKPLPIHHLVSYQCLQEPCFDNIVNLYLKTTFNVEQKFLFEDVLNIN